MESKKHFKSFLPVVLLFAVVTLCTNCNDSQPKKTYEPTWESLQSHPFPQWFGDAKFGIFIHWGVYAVPAYHEWYMVYMSPESRYGRNLGGPPYTASQGGLSDSVFHANIQEKANQYHRDNYGVDFSYDAFIPMFKAEQFDPSAWAALFKQAGARYVVLTAKHGDEFALWPSKYTERNAMEMGPHRDLVGELTKEVRAQGIKMGLYHNTTYSFWDERYPDTTWVAYMNNSIKELVDLYHPDILWGDVPVGPARDEHGKPLGAEHWNSKEVIAYFYNHSKDPDEVVTNERWGTEMSASTDKNPEKAISGSLWARYADSWNVGDGAFLGDFQTPERRNIPGILHQPWETCDAIDPTSWGYNRRLPDDKYMSANEIVDYLADIVSKGGNLLINIGPRADGTIPEVMQQRLQGVGSWLEVNGEAIYGTTPWTVYGEGPTKQELGSWVNQEGEYGFQAGDVRFTRKGDILYAILLEWPGDEVTLKSLEEVQINKISMLGSQERIQWEQSGEGLIVSLPSDPVSSHANTLKFECEGGIYYATDSVVDKGHQVKEWLRTNPDVVVYLPKGENDGDNEHFQVFEAPKSDELLAIWTQSSVEGHGDNRAVLARSSNGREWSDPVVLAGKGPGRSETRQASWVFPVVSEKGRIYCFYTKEIDQSDIRQYGGVMGCCYSDDNGYSWTFGKDIIVPKGKFDNPDPAYPVNWIVWQTPVRDSQGRYIAGYTRWSSETVIKSPGNNWCDPDSRSAFMRFENIDDNPLPEDIEISWFPDNDNKSLAVPHKIYPEISVSQEPAIVLLPDNRLFTIMRTMTGHLWYSVSEDHGKTWRDPEVLRYKDGGKKVNNPIAPSPLYALSDGRFLLVFNNNNGTRKGYDQFQKNWEGVNQLNHLRNPAYIAVGEFRANAHQPVWFSKPKKILDTQDIVFGPKGTASVAMYPSLTEKKGQRTLWYPDRKHFLLGKQITDEILQDMKVPE